MSKHLLFAVAELLLVIVPMTKPPITIEVCTLPFGVPFCYDTTGTVRFGGGYDYSTLPSQIHHYVPSDGSRLFLFIIETNPQERILVRANELEEARLRFNGWADGKRGFSLLTVHEVFDKVTDELLREKGYY